MINKEIEFLKRIQVTFRIEAEEHLNALSSGLIDMEKPQTEENLAVIFETLFREIHSLKGAARSVDQKEIESICQPLESAFSALKSGEITLSQSAFDIFYKTVERLSKLITGSDLTITIADRQLQNELIRNLKGITARTLNTTNVEKSKQDNKLHYIESGQVTSTDSSSGSDSPDNIRSKSRETVRIRVSKLDTLLLQAEEFIQTKIAISQRIKELKEINTGRASFNADKFGLKGGRSDTSNGLLTEWIEENDLQSDKIRNQISAITSLMELDKYRLDRMVSDHLETMKHVLMLPVSTIVESFPGMVREISREQNKEIEFLIRGAEIEIDKRILEELKDPLMHLLRNSIDHGIDKPRERILAHKPSFGTIILTFTSQESDMIEITLTDDGKGIDLERVLKAAIKTGIISSEADHIPDTDEILSMIYQSGVSTSSIITDISGHGLGLSIVWEKVEKLNGRISVESDITVGTTFRIVLPMSLTAFRGLLVRVKESMFIIPTINVERVIKVKPEDITTVESHEIIHINDLILSVVDLGEVLGLAEHELPDSNRREPNPENPDYLRIAVLVSGEHRMAFKIDEIIDEQQVLVKSPGKLLARIRNISGATVLGSGSVVPVLHIPDVMKSALSSIQKSKRQISKDNSVKRIKKILVAEDSVTARMLLKNILETAGYKVTTAVDGLDAFTRAGNLEFDLILSDVDMPVMNGFELTSKIRNDKKLSELPVVLVTALESIEDRERGIEVGADAYIIKSSFDQTNLLEIIRKLL